MQRIAPSEYRRMLQRDLAPLGVPILFLGDTDGSSAVLQNVTNFESLELGMVVSGPGIAAGSTIQAMSLLNDTITLSKNTTSKNVQAVLSAQAPFVLMVHLFQAPAAPGPEPTPSSFQEANFDNYAALQITQFVGPFTDASGQAVIQSEQLNWILVAPPVRPNNIYGYWVDYLPNQSGQATVKLWEPFTNPQPMVSAGQAIPLTVPFELPLPGNAVLLTGP
jgi:hypothetical protein